MHLCWEHHGAGSRVAKYSHNLPAIAELSAAAKAVIAELFVRGPQTPGELRTHASRMFAFRDLEHMATVLRELETHSSGPLVTEMSRQAGRRESRFRHLLGEFDEAAEQAAAAVETASSQPTDGPRTVPRPGLEQRMAELEQRVEALERLVSNPDSLKGPADTSNA
jgi:uncharacterized protein YceH (UPF0502 family)